MAYDPMKHLIRIQGNREYLPVAQRLVWFREAHPDWGIETHAEVLELEEGVAIFSATVSDENGRIRARATKMETARGFADFVEKAETGAIGRALALCGFGTQFAPELEEGERVVDSPRQPEPRGSGLRFSETARACAEPTCGRAMTQAQYDFSVRAYGKPLCPHCQKQHKEVQAQPAAAN